jgi:hypothetical protein
MNTLDIQKLQPKKGTIRIGGKSIKIGDSSGISQTKGGTTSQVLEALRALGKLKLPYNQYVGTE